MNKTYKCLCGKEFNNSQSFNGHKAHCKIHLKSTGKLEQRELLQKEFIKIGHEASAEKAAEKRNNAIKQWVLEKHSCEKCGKVMTEKFGSGRFCSRKCANSRQHTTETKNRISAGVKANSSSSSVAGNHLSAKHEYYYFPNYCVICGKALSYEDRHRKTCSEECLQKRFLQMGQTSYFTKVKRSKNEIEFCRLCEDYFSDVEHNIPLFNGWDADVIIHDIKYAILWNGIWHYEKVTPNHKIEQVKNRDKLKLEEITANGYVPYIIKDMGQYNPEFVKAEFEKFIHYINK